MANKTFYRITENQFININLVLSVDIKEEEILLCFVGGEEKSYKIRDLDTHFYNFLNINLLP